jgi:pSer/pThr/pTyr-binding forkhead associated (FHA) protein
MSASSAEMIKKRLASIFSSGKSTVAAAATVERVGDRQAEENTPTVPLIAGKKADDKKEEQSPALQNPFAESMIFALEDGSGRLYEASGSVVRIGRRKENQIVITASEISREHVEISINNGIVYVRALSESNITRLNDRTVKDRMPIRAGDKLNMGGTDFIVRKARPA